MFNNETYNKLKTPEIGDIFIIKKDKNKIRPCKYQNKRFEIKKVSKSGETIYYDDLRTNIKCKCSICNPSCKTGRSPKEVERTINLSQIEIVEKRDQYQRNLKLKLLNIK